MTSSSCDISVIVPAYNSAATLSRALESILGQEIDAHIEILVCDDASTDNTTAIAAEIASRHPDKVRLIGSSVNRGLVTNYFEALAPDDISPTAPPTITGSAPTLWHANTVCSKRIPKQWPFTLRGRR